MSGAAERPEALDLETAQRLLARVDGSPRARTIAPGEQGAKGAVYIVECDDGREIALKVYAPTFGTRMLKERMLYERLKGVQLPIPRVLASEPAGRPDGTSMLAMTVLPGERLLNILDELSEVQVAEIYREIGEIQQRLHEVEFPEFSDFIGEDGVDLPDNVAFMREQVATVMHWFRERGGSRKLGASIEAYFAEREELFARCVTPVLCHNDLHESNLLVERHGADIRITGLVDFENAFAADPILDLAKTHNHARRASEATLSAMLAGYGPLPEGWREPFDLYLLFHAIDLWGWYADGGSAAALPGLERQMRQLIGQPSRRDRLFSRLS